MPYLLHEEAMIGSSSDQDVIPTTLIRFELF
jgi:hypothetical protein